MHRQDHKISVRLLQLSFNSLLLYMKRGGEKKWAKCMFNLKICCKLRSCPQKQAQTMVWLLYIWLIKTVFPSLHGSCLWQKWLAGLSCLHVALPCQFFQSAASGRGRGGGGFFITQDNLKPQLRDQPFSSSSSPSFRNKLWRGIPCFCFCF